MFVFISKAALILGMSITTKINQQIHKYIRSICKKHVQPLRLSTLTSNTCENRWSNHTKDVLLNRVRTNQIMQGMNKSRLYKPQAVMVTINSPGGSLSNAKAIVDILKQYSDKKNTPIYCFAEDQCLNSANTILTCGAKVYANSMSLIGDFGYTWSSLWFKEFAEKYQVRQEYITAGENKIKFDRFKELKPEAEKWMKNYLYLYEHELRLTVTNNRASKFQRLNMGKEDIQSKIFNQGILRTEAALEGGLIDAIKNYDDIMST